MSHSVIRTLFLSLFIGFSNLALAVNCEDQNFAGLHYDFYRNAFKPGSDTSNSYLYYPGSAYFTGEKNINNLINSNSLADGFFFQWANRCHDINGSGCGGTNGNSKGNSPTYSYGGNTYRFFFSTHIKANMCTLAQAYRLAGTDDLEITDLANNWGFTALFSESQLDNYIANPANNDRFEDVCYIYGSDISQHIKGIVLDYEVQDNRHVNTTTNFLTRYANYLHSQNLKAHLWTNPAGGAGWLKSGFSGGVNGNAQLVFDVMDEVALLAYSKTTDVSTELYNQSRLYTPQNSVYNKWINRQKFYVITGLGGFTLAKSKDVYDFVIDRKHKGVAVWNNGADYSVTDCNSSTYQMVRCLAYGDCGNTN